MDWYLILVPFLLLPIVVLFYFVGCLDWSLTPRPDEDEDEDYEARVQVTDRAAGTFVLVGDDGPENDNSVVGQWVHFGSDDETESRYQGTTGWVYYARYEELDPGEEPLKAIWHFSDVPPGYYQVAVSYSEHHGRATRCQYYVYVEDQDEPIHDFEVNQQRDEERTVPFVWSSAHNFRIESRTNVRLELVIHDGQDGVAIADAARLSTTATEE